MRVLTLENIKEYLRVDSDEDDTLINLFTEYAKEEIEDSTGVKFNEEGNSETYNMAMLIVIADRGIISAHTFLYSLYSLLSPKFPSTICSL